MRYSIPYSNPNYEDEELFIKEIINGTFYKVVDYQRKHNSIYTKRYNMDLSSLIIDGKTTPEQNDHITQTYDRQKIQEMAWLPHWEEEEEEEIDALHNDYARFMKPFTISIDSNYNSSDYDFICYDGSGNYYKNTKDNFLYYLNIKTGIMKKIDGTENVDYSGGYCFLKNLSTYEIYFSKDGNLINSGFAGSDTQVFSSKTYNTFLIDDAANKKFKIVDINSKPFQKIYFDEDDKKQIKVLDWLSYDGVIEKFVMLKNLPYIVINGKRYFLKLSDIQEFFLSKTTYYFEFISKYDFLGGNNINYYLKKQGYYIKIVDVIDVAGGSISLLSDEETDDIENILVTLNDDTKVTYTAYYTSTLEAGEHIFKRDWKLLPKKTGRKYPNVGMFGSVKKIGDSYSFDGYKYKKGKTDE